MNHAISRGHIATNPTRCLKRNPRPKLTRFLSREEIGRLHEVLDGYQLRRPPVAGLGLSGAGSALGLFRYRKCPHGNHSGDRVLESPGVDIGIRAGLKRIDYSCSRLWRFDSWIFWRSLAATYRLNGSFRPANPVDVFFGFQLFDP